MKMNNKGYAVSGVLYTILLMFLLILSAILSMMSTRKVLLDKMKKDTLEKLDQKHEINYDINSYSTNGMVLFYDGITNAEKVRNGDISNNIFEDLSGNGNDGILDSFDFNETSGWGDNYLKFDGNNDVVDTSIYGETFANTYEDFTMTMLVKINKVTTTGNSYEPYDSSTMFGATYYSGFGIYWTTNDVLTTQYSLGIVMRNNSGMATSTYVSNNFDIQHISFVHDRSNNIQSLYVNGIKVAERETLPQDDFAYPNNMGNIKLGGSGLYGGSSLNVRTDMNLYTAKIYSRALSQGEIKLDYEIDKYRYEI